jgi:hypothetical protein
MIFASPIIKIDFSRDIMERLHAVFTDSHTVLRTLAFLYHVNNGFSPFRVSVSSTYAQRSMKSSWLVTDVSLPVMARYMSSMTLKSVGKKMSK